MRYLFSSALLIMSLSAQEKNYVPLPANITFTFSNTNNGLPQGPIQKFEYEVTPITPHNEIHNSLWQSLGLGSFLKVATGATVSAGICVLGYLEYCAHQLHATTGWQTWKHDIALVSLYELAQPEILKALLTDMHERYHNHGPQTAIMLVCLNDIKQEREALMHVQKVLGLVCWTKLQNVLPKASTLTNAIDDRLARLAFIEKTLLHRLDSAAKL